MKRGKGRKKAKTHLKEGLRSSLLSAAKRKEETEKSLLEERPREGEERGKRVPPSSANRRRERLVLGLRLREAPKRVANWRANIIVVIVVVVVLV